ncbi:hypothetical protein C8Q79DRAFT_15037 [Trametes meyenii]|nr:hypothetical protein C8Q79DRAFT_15037 [Trametes meyenii]
MPVLLAIQYGSPPRPHHLRRTVTRATVPTLSTSTPTLSLLARAVEVEANLLVEVEVRGRIRSVRLGPRTPPPANQAPWSTATRLTSRRAAACSSSDTTPGPTSPVLVEATSHPSRLEPVPLPRLDRRGLPSWPVAATAPPACRPSHVARRTPHVSPENNS